jgi:hypothetical protein
MGVRFESSLTLIYSFNETVLFSPFYSLWDKKFEKNKIYERVVELRTQTSSKEAIACFDGTLFIPIMRGRFEEVVF